MNFLSAQRESRGESTLLGEDGPGNHPREQALLSWGAEQAVLVATGKNGTVNTDWYLLRSCQGFSIPMPTISTAKYGDGGNFISLYFLDQCVM
jgi:hypothetical protein